MNEFHGPVAARESIATGYAALDAGCTFLDTAERYGGHLGVDGEPEYVRQACDPSLPRLGAEVIDVDYQHRVDPRPLALAWLAYQGQDVVPIPGSLACSRLAENLGALDAGLFADAPTRLNELAAVGVAAGDRYPDVSSVHR